MVQCLNEQQALWQVEVFLDFNLVLNPLLGKCCLVYLYDIAIFSPDKNQHLQELKAVFQLLNKAGLQMKIEEVFFHLQ